MEKEFVPYQESLELKELGFDEPCFNRFYTKPQSKMFGVDEKGRHYPIKNTSKKLYTIGEDFVLNDSNVILAPLYQQAFRWFREKYNLKNKYGVFPHHTIMFNYVIEGGKEEEAELACLRKLIEIVKEKK